MSAQDNNVMYLDTRALRSLVNSHIIHFTTRYAFGDHHVRITLYISTGCPSFNRMECHEQPLEPGL